MTKIKRTVVAVIATFAFCMAIAVGSNTSIIDAQASSKPYICKLSKAEKSAKRFIAMRESGGRYRANGRGVYGRYQLSRVWLRGDLSKANQERAADRYVHSHYGSWRKAKRHWMRFRSY